MKSKYIWDSCWPDTYQNLQTLVQDPKTRPDFIIADFFAEDAAKDMMIEHHIPIAIVWPQMPFMMAPASYIPGQPGFQVDMSALTSEHASLRSRLRNELVLLWATPHLIPWMIWKRKLRRSAGVAHSLPLRTKPDYLVLVNSFFGLETPKDLPPLIAPVGPILADRYPPLDDVHSEFLEKHDRTIYVALGTHILLPQVSFTKLLQGLVMALDTGTINGVIWSIGNAPRKVIDRSQTVRRTDGRLLHVGDLLDGRGLDADDFLVPTFAPQRAILDHPSTRLYLSHGGGSSANEVLYHGKPVLTLGFFFDQLCNSTRLLDAGVGLSLDKFTFTPQGVCDKVCRIIRDEDGGSIGRNVERMRRIARVASRRKHLAADLVEEVLYDSELRFGSDGGREIQPMHLQTADARMPFWKVKNWDLWAFVLGGTVLTPLAAGWIGRTLWVRRSLLVSFLSEQLASFWS